jgi:hypothetical protein
MIIETQNVEDGKVTEGRRDSYNPFTLDNPEIEICIINSHRDGSDILAPPGNLYVTTSAMPY